MQVSCAFFVSADNWPSFVSKTTMGTPQIFFRFHCTMTWTSIFLECLAFAIMMILFILVQVLMDFHRGGNGFVLRVKAFYQELYFGLHIRLIGLFTIRFELRTFCGLKVPKEVGSTFEHTGWSWYCDALPSPRVNPLEGSPKCSRGKRDSEGSSRLPAL